MGKSTLLQAESTLGNSFIHSDPVLLRQNMVLLVHSHDTDYGTALRSNLGASWRGRSENVSVQGVTQLFRDSQKVQTQIWGGEKEVVGREEQFGRQR